MVRLSATVRIATGLICLGTCILLAFGTLDWRHDAQRDVARGRAALVESIATHCSTLLVHDNNPVHLEQTLQGLVARNSDLVASRICHGDEPVVEVGEFQAVDSKESDHAVRIRAPIFDRGQKWGYVELEFERLTKGLWGVGHDGWLLELTFLAGTGTVLYVLYLLKMLSHLDPSKVIPDRVQAALDTLAEGLLVLDRNQRIVLANRAFAENIGESAQQLQGRLVSELPWLVKEPSGKTQFPWSEAMKDGGPRLGRIIDIQLSEQSRRTYMVNSSPIVSEGVRQGVLVSFDDVTLQEQRKEELERALKVLGESREKIRQQNEELKVLATRDPLTTCLNRRSFFEQVEDVWQQAQRSGLPVACVMLDVDHFKSINDNHGHSKGDEVLRRVGTCLLNNTRASELLCRYGGEEFCLVLQRSTIDQSAKRGEELRTLLASMRFSGLSVTASVGVSAMDAHHKSFQELLEQADRSLYVAKRRGRNQVARWDEVQNELETDKETSVPHVDRYAMEPDAAIPFHAVTALISALSYRDARTAEHSRRVADLCVAAADGMMSVRELYVLETAALLHDIGKIGVPDSILLKPGPLNDDEWQLMGLHDRMGVEMIQTTFGSKELLRIVETHHAWYGDPSRYPDLPTGKSIPLGARILAISDAYDAMVSDRVYRKGRSPEEAFRELRRCAGRQFDPDLVTRFTDSVTDTDRTRETKLTVSKQTALRIGLQIERLTGALDTNDLSGVIHQAGNLKATALASGLARIAEAASDLEKFAMDDAEVASLVSITATLLDLCRATQKAYLEIGEQPRALKERFDAKVSQSGTP